MTKNEFISKYGEERYREMVKKTLERYHAKPKVKKERKERAHRLTNNVTTTVKVPCPFDMSYEEFEEWKTKWDAAFQKRLRKEWHTITDKDFILVTDAGNRIEGKLKVAVSLNQLGIDVHTKNAFKTLVKNSITEL